MLILLTSALGLAPVGFDTSKPSGGARVLDEKWIRLTGLYAQKVFDPGRRGLSCLRGTAVLVRRRRCWGRERGGGGGRKRFWDPVSVYGCTLLTSLQGQIGRFMIVIILVPLGCSTRINVLGGQVDDRQVGKGRTRTPVRMAVVCFVPYGNGSYFSTTRDGW